ncbi:MAG: sulfatase-like hydrolase/transferase [Planctomycetota bacterium]
MKNRLSLLSLGAVCLFTSSANAQNVLVVLIDDLGADEVALYTPDANTAPTPTLEALAADGVRFENAWAMPNCSPTRATLLTGRYPTRHGVGVALPFGPDLPDEEVILPEVYRRSAQLGGPDVATSIVGKWHLVQLGQDIVHPVTRGFSFYDGDNLGGLGQPFSYEQWPRTIADDQGASKTSIETGYATTVQVDAARDWIAEQAGPWFCYLALHAPHTPFHAPPAELHSYDLEGLDIEQDPIPFFHAMTEAADTELGRLLSEIDPAVLAETTVIVIGDNGTTGDVVEAPFDPTRSKGSLYRNGIRVPLIVSGNQVAFPGREVDALVDVSDLFATSLELSGVDWQAALPEGLEVDSVSLLPYVVQPFATPQRDWILSQTKAPVLDFLPGDGITFLNLITANIDLIAGAVAANGTTVRNGGFKFIRNSTGFEELYNLTADPFEDVNLLLLPFLPAPAAAAYAELAAVVDELGFEAN